MVRIKRMFPEARLPVRATAGSSGVDLQWQPEWEGFKAPAPCVLSPGAWAAFPTGIAVEVPVGFEAQIRPRSSMTNRGLLCQIGTVDSDFRGELRVCLYNLSGLDLGVKPGDRIAQLVIAPVVLTEFVEADELTPTKRGTGGFGSTGR